VELRETAIDLLRKRLGRDPTEEEIKAERDRKTRKNPTPHNRPPQSVASSSSGVVARRAARGASERRTGLPVTFRQLPEGKVRASGDASTLDREGIPAYPSSPR
jgi:hypothetical protein